MNSQLTQTSTLPPLSSPELDRLRSRLEQGLLRLARLSAEEISGTITEAALTETTLTETALLEPPRELESVSDRRAFPRREGNCRVAVCRLTEEEGFLTPQQIEWRLHSTPLKGTLDDLSLSGAAIILPGPLAVGESVVLRLFCPRRDRNADQQATIIRSQPHAEGGCKATCRFTKKLPLEQVSYFSRFLDNTNWI